MGANSVSRRSIIGLVAAATTGGCVGQVLDRPSVALTGVRLHNWTHYETDVRLELFREGDRVLDERLSLSPLRSPGSVASFDPGWSVEPAQYRIALAAPDGEATDERRLPADDFSWDGCAYVDADLENGWEPGQPVGPDAERWFETHLQEVSDADDFSSEHCSDE